MKKTIIFTTLVAIFTSCTTNTITTSTITTSTDSTTVVANEIDVIDSTITTTYTVTPSETK